MQKPQLSIANSFRTDNFSILPEPSYNIIKNDSFQLTQSIFNTEKKLNSGENNISSNKNSCSNSSNNIQSNN